MGLLAPMARIILREHRFRKIAGEILLIGRQTVHMQPNQAVALCQEEGIEANCSKIEIDNSTRNAIGKGFISDRSFLGLFTTARVHALDVSDYEAADIVCNLNGTIPVELEGRFDFIYNGSCLDNIFDPANSLKNLTKLLKPAGRIVHLEHGTPVNGPYLMFPPDWFYDYYVINNFADCKIYIARFKHYEGPWDVVSWDPIQVINGNVQATWSVPPQQNDFFVITIAEKGTESTFERSPIQAQYRSKSEVAEYIRLALSFKSSPRPRLDNQ